MPKLSVGNIMAMDENIMAKNIVTPPPKFKAFDYLFPLTEPNRLATKITIFDRQPILLGGKS